MTDKEKFILENYTITRDGNIFRGKTRLHFRIDKNGYSQVRLQYNSKGDYQPFQLHRIIALAHIEKPEGYNIVNHKDLDKSNNDSSNLEWSTVKLNTQHAYDNRAYPSIKKVKCVEPNGKIHIFPSESHASRYYNYANPSVINAILTGRNKNPIPRGKRKGLYFEYTNEGVTTIERKTDTVTSL